MQSQPSILIVDDDEIFRSRLVRAFTERGYETRGAANYDEAIRQAEADSPEMAVLDL